MSKNSILVIGGSKEAKEKSVLASTEVVTLDLNEKEIKIISFPGPSLKHARRGSSVLWLETEVLVVGGCGVNQTQPRISDPSAKSWTLQEISLSCGQSCNASCKVGSKIYLLGGWDGKECLKSVEIFDISLKNSNSSESLLTPFKNATAVERSEDQILLIGGWDGARTLRTLFSYCIKSGQLEMVGMLPYPIECHATTINDRNVFISGGFDGQSIRKEICLLNLDILDISLLPVTLAVARECHTTEILGNYFVVIAGWNGFEALDSVEVFEISSVFPFLTRVKSSGCLIEQRNRPCSVVMPL